MKKSQDQEKRITKSLNQIKAEARTTPGSGSMYCAKSDVVCKHFRVEAKTKVKPAKSVSVKKEWMDKIEQEAFETGKIPALAFSFGTQTDYFVLKDRDFYSLIEELEEYRNGNR